MNQPFFSIIIPTFNSEKSISFAIKSILNQELRSFEILIVDGKSTDDTLNIIRQFDDPRIITKSEKDKGIYDAMNKGVDLSKGKWLYFLGSDDSLHNLNVLNQVKSAIEKYPESLFLYGDVFTSANYLERYEGHNYQKLVSLNICHQSIFYHHTLFDSTRYNLKYTICADWDFNLKVFRSKNKPIYINKVISNYNLEGASNDWGTHPDFADNFKPLTMVLRYRNVMYFIYIYILKQLKVVKSLISHFFTWISP